MQSEPCKSPLKCVKNIKSLHSLLSLKYPTVTFLPFNLHISNYQRFIKTVFECISYQEADAATILETAFVEYAI